MRTVVAYPGPMAHAQHAARALWEAGCLSAFVTTTAHRPDGRFARILAGLPGPQARGLLRQLARRRITEVPPGLVRAHPAWEVLRVLAARGGAGPILVDRIWDRMSHGFDDLVARRYVPRAEAVMAFEYTALAAFEAAARRGVARILQLPSRDSAESAAILAREQARWPGLEAPEDRYFDARFARRYARRRAEIAAADLVVANSALTARSHVAAGADPARITIVPLAAPPALDPAALREPARCAPLRVLWAGPFSLRKGAPDLLAAWRRLKAGPAARLDVYGEVTLPAAFVGAPDAVAFHGSVPQAQLFAASTQADILVLPTLSDGFGMVVLEAMAHGLPVIVSDQAGAAEAVTGENGLVVPAGDAAALAEALRWCLDNRERVAAMRHAALDTARRRQWSDYRRDLVSALSVGLAGAGYAPRFGAVPSEGLPSESLPSGGFSPGGLP